MKNLDAKHFWPKVVQVLPTDNFEVYAYFNDGSVRLYDVKPLLKSGTVFEPLMDIRIFKNKLAVINDTVAWDMGGHRDSRKQTRCSKMWQDERPKTGSSFLASSPCR
ncbi:putative transcriptional regulators [Candidatus Termititenax persephonae]|uniref:Transcriptional regulators n=1 Tax=Candidatus Termititenax persephonae TaxID=2218525 RepID=A0A388TI24_9BACT|nr:putative transcriptional regulators [Candidatus Termititenax persephonae]